MTIMCNPELSCYLEGRYVWCSEPRAFMADGLEFVTIGLERAGGGSR